MHALLQFPLAPKTFLAVECPDFCLLNLVSDLQAHLHQQLDFTLQLVALSWRVRGLAGRDLPLCFVLGAPEPGLRSAHISFFVHAGHTNTT